MGYDYIYDKFPGVVNSVNEFCENSNLKIDMLTKDGCPTYLIYKK